MVIRYPLKNRTIPLLLVGGWLMASLAFGQDESSEQPYVDQGGVVIDLDPGSRAGAELPTDALPERPLLKSGVQSPEEGEGLILGQEALAPARDLIPRERLERLAALIEQQQWSQALVILDELRSSFPDYTPLMLKHATVLALTGRYQAAHDLVGDYLLRRPLDSEAAHARVGILLALKRFSEALRINTFLLESDPDHSLGRYHAVCLEALDDPAAEPPASRPPYTLARLGEWIDWLAGDEVFLKPALGEEAFGRLLEAVLGTAQPKLTLKSLHMQLHQAQVALQKSNWGRALIHFDLLHQAGVSPPALQLAAAKCLFHLQKFAEARRLLLPLAPLYPDDFEFFYNLGLIQLQLEAYEASLRAFRASRALGKASGAEAPEALFGEACSLLMCGQKAEGRELLEALAGQQREALRQWLVGDRPYLEAAREAIGPLH